MTQTILCNLGGTNVRFAVLSDGETTRYQELSCADFDETYGRYESFIAALGKYCSEQGLKNSGRLVIAAAGPKTDSDNWDVAQGESKWNISNSKLDKAGWSVELIMNDFEAATWALKSNNLAATPITEHTSPKADNKNKCVVGVGTGLGFGYFCPAEEYSSIIRTHGGHMPIAPVSDYQRDIIKLAAIYKPSEFRQVIFEDLLSGTGLYVLYCCIAHLENGALPKHKDRQIKDQFDVTKNQDDPHCIKATKILTELLGSFCASAAVFGHAYGGIYLKNGFSDKFFDPADFMRGFLFDAHPVVYADLESTPIFRLLKDGTDLELKGLVNAFNLSNN